jgi:hypothetical protein
MLQDAGTRAGATAAVLLNDNLSVMLLRTSTSTDLTRSAHHAIGNHTMLPTSTQPQPISSTTTQSIA